MVIFLSGLASSGTFASIADLPFETLQKPTLNSFAALPRVIHRDVRQAIQNIYQNDGLAGFPESSKEDLYRVRMHIPVEVRDFTDTSCSFFHVRNAGRIITKSDRLPPSFSYGPLAYQGRAASIVPSGTPIKRPWGYFPDPQWSKQADREDHHPILYGPSSKVDYEVELAAVIGKPLDMCQCLTPQQAEEHVFGFVVLNDWSARDIQGFEMSPLGPFNGKSFGTSISSWIVTADALQPFKLPSHQQDLPVKSPLHSPSLTTYSITIDVSIISEGRLTTTGRCEIPSLYWTPDQMVAHTTVSGSPLRTGDLIATGTISGDVVGAYGCLLEATEGGLSPIRLVNGSYRSFLEDGDIVYLVGYAGDAQSGVGFGECIGELISACD